jgi:AraC-like DNA-binding protein
MSFLCEEYRPDSPFVEAFWRVTESSEGTYLSAADGQWDLAFIHEDDTTRVLLTGPSSHAVPVRYKADNRNFGIRFKRGVLLPHTPAQSMLNSTVVLPRTGSYFWLQGRRWRIPSVGAMDVFVGHLAREKIIAQDTLVVRSLAGGSHGVSARTLQRHFLQTTGMTYSYLRQIDRAKQAITLLQSGQAACQAGYADQAHLTRSLRVMTSKTPAQIIGRQSFPFTPYAGKQGVIQVR